MPPAANDGRPVPLSLDDLPAGWGVGAVVAAERLANTALGEGASKVGYHDTAPLIGADNVQDAIDALKGGGGGGFTPPDEFWVDQNTPAGTYATIALALAAITNAGSILHLHGAQTHVFDLDASDALAALTGTQATGTNTVISAPLAVDDFILGVVGVAGPRTSGAGDFDATLGTPTLLAAEIAAAVNDPANGLTGTYTVVAVGAVITITATDPGTAGNAIGIDPFTAPPGGVTTSGLTLAGGADSRVDFLSYAGAATIQNDVAGETYFSTGAVLGFTGINFDLGFTNTNVVSFGCIATFEECSGYFGEGAAQIQLTGVPGGVYPNLTFNDCVLTGTTFVCGPGSGSQNDEGGPGGLVTWNRCTVPGRNTGGTPFVTDPEQVNSFWAFNTCLFNPTVSAGGALFNTDQNNAEDSRMTVTYTDTLITISGDGNAVMAEAGQAIVQDFKDSRIINDATTSQLDFGVPPGNQTIGSRILRPGDNQPGGYPIPYLPGATQQMSGGFSAPTSYGEAVYDTSVGAWQLPGRVTPMRTLTTVAGPSALLTSILDGLAALATVDGFIFHIRGDISVQRTSPFVSGSGAHFTVDAVFSLFAGTYTLLFGGVAPADYDTSGGEYAVTLGSGADGIEFLCDQGIYGNESEWDATLQVVSQ